MREWWSEEWRVEPAGQLKRNTWGEAASMQQGLDKWLWQLMTEMLAIFVLAKNVSLHFLHTRPDLKLRTRQLPPPPIITREKMILV